MDLSQFGAVEIKDQKPSLESFGAIPYDQPTKSWVPEIPIATPVARWVKNKLVPDVVNTVTNVANPILDLIKPEFNPADPASRQLLMNNPQEAVKQILGDASGFNRAQKLNQIAQGVVQAAPQIVMQAPGQINDYMKQRYGMDLSAAPMAYAQAMRGQNPNIDFGGMIQKTGQSLYEHPFETALDVSNVVLPALGAGKGALTKIVPEASKLAEAAKIAEVAKPTEQTLFDVSKFAKQVLPEIKVTPNKPGWFDSTTAMLRTSSNILDRWGIKKEIYEPIKQSIIGSQNEREQMASLLNTLKNTKGINKQSSMKIFNVLNGDSAIGTLNEGEQFVANTIKSVYQNYATRLGIPESGQIKDYITHLFEKTFSKGQKVPPELLTALKKNPSPSNINMPFLKERLGAEVGLKRDAFAALDAYAGSAIKKLYIEPALKATEPIANQLGGVQRMYVDFYRNNVAGRPTMFEHFADATLNPISDAVSSLVNRVTRGKVNVGLGVRPFKQLSSALTNRVYRGALQFNIGSAATNLTQGVNTLAELGPKWTAQGYTDLATQAGRQLVEQAGVAGKGITGEFHGVSLLEGAKPLPLQDVFGKAEFVNRGSTYLGARAKALSEGMDAIAADKYAKDMVAKLQFEYSKADTPLIMQHPAFKPLLQFSSFPIKQTELIGSWINEGAWDKLARYTLAQETLYRGAKAAGLDFSNALGTGVFPSSPAPLVKMGFDFGSLVNSYQTGDEAAKEKAVSNLANALPMLLIPGGVQAKRIYDFSKVVDQSNGQTELRYYNKRTGKLTYTLTPTEAVGKLFGLKPAKLQQLNEKQNYLNMLNKNFSKDRADFLQAIKDGDTAKQQDIIKRNPILFKNASGMASAVKNYAVGSETPAYDRMLQNAPLQIQMQMMGEGDGNE